MSWLWTTRPSLTRACVGVDVLLVSIILLAAVSTCNPLPTAGVTCPITV